MSPALRLNTVRMRTESSSDANPSPQQFCRAGLVAIYHTSVHVHQVRAPLWVLARNASGCCLRAEPCDPAGGWAEPGPQLSSEMPKQTLAVSTGCIPDLIKWDELSSARWRTGRSLRVGAPGCRDQAPAVRGSVLSHFRPFAYPDLVSSIAQSAPNTVQALGNGGFNCWGDLWHRSEGTR